MSLRKVGIFVERSFNNRKGNERAMKALHIVGAELCMINVSIYPFLEIDTLPTICFGIMLY